MSQAATAFDQGTAGTDYQAGGVQKKDVAESVLRTIDKSTKKAAGVSLFHLLTLGSIGASIALFLAGKKQAGIFIGLWPPTFQALKAVADTNKEDQK